MTVLAIDVGCLECALPTEVVGRYPDEAAAQEAAQAYATEQWGNAPAFQWDAPGEASWGGQGVMVLIDLDVEPPTIVAVGR